MLLYRLPTLVVLAILLVETRAALPQDQDRRHPTLLISSLLPSRLRGFTTTPDNSPDIDKVDEFSTPTNLLPFRMPPLPTPPTTTEPLTSVWLHSPKENVDTIDQYRCSGYDLRNVSLQAKGWVAKPTVTKNIHHMTLYFCSSVGNLRSNAIQQGLTWNCKNVEDVCLGEPKFQVGAGFENMLGTNKIPERVVIPNSATWKIGKGTEQKFAIIQVHNNAIIRDDQSGFDILLDTDTDTDTKEQKLDRYFQIGWDLTSFKVNTLQLQQDAGLDPGIPPGLDDFTIVEEWTIPSAFKIWGVHMHYHSIGKKFTIEWMEENGSQWKMLSQRSGKNDKTIFLRDTVELQKGYRIRATCTWDSSKRTVHTPFGFDAFDNEMSNVFLMCTQHWGEKQPAVVKGVKEAASTST